MYLVTHKVVPFVFVNGRYVRAHKVREVPMKSNAKGNSLSKFPRTIGRIGHHKWA
jgi:hypothetical protein